MPTLRFGKVWQVIRHFGVLLLLQQCSRGTKKRSSLADNKGLGQICINSFDERMLSHDRWLWFFFGGAYGSLPDAAIWWCLRTGGGGVLTS